jgi:hypothetical protein
VKVATPVDAVESKTGEEQVVEIPEVKEDSANENADMEAEEILSDDGSLDEDEDNSEE